MHRLLEEYLPKLGMQTRKWILDAAAVAAYHAQTQWPVARLLVCDGAPQFTWITEELGLCWVHEGRHYKKLFPYVAQHQKLLEDFLGDFWDFLPGVAGLPAAANPWGEEAVWRGDLTPCSPPRRATGHWTSGLG